MEGIRRSVVASRDLKAGSILKLTDLTCKRPGTGINPPEIDSLVGCKLNCDLVQDMPINWKHIVS